MAIQHTEIPDDPRLRLLLRAYAEAQATIVAQLRAAMNAHDLVTVQERRRMLADVIRVLDRLGVETDPEARAIVEAMYRAGAARADRELPSGPQVGQVTNFSFGRVSEESVRALQESILGRLQDARRTIGRQVADVFAAEQRRATVQGLLGAQGSHRLAAGKMRRRLEQQGHTAFVDKAGRRWSLSDYTDMAVRTVTREAVVAGSVDRIASHGIDLVQVTTHSSACLICQPYEGQIMSLSGNPDGPDGVSVSPLVLPPFHPRCAHTVSPYVPALAAL